LVFIFIHLKVDAFGLRIIASHSTQTSANAPVIYATHNTGRCFYPEMDS